LKLLLIGRTTKKNIGVTLVELAVAGAVIVLAFTTVLKMFHYFSKSSDITKRSMRNQMARSCMSRICKELKTATDILIPVYTDFNPSSTLKFLDAKSQTIAYIYDDSSHSLLRLNLNTGKKEVIADRFKSKSDVKFYRLQKNYIKFRITFRCKQKSFDRKNTGDFKPSTLTLMTGVFLRNRLY